MLGYVILALLDCPPYVLSGTDTPCPDTTLKLHNFESGTKVYVIFQGFPLNLVSGENT